MSTGTRRLALTYNAELVIAPPNPAFFQVLRRYTVGEDATWAHPVINGNRVSVKDAESLAP